MAKSAKKLYGSDTEKAIKNFPISGWPMPVEFIQVLACIKEHAAVVNGELKQIPTVQAKAIAKVAATIKKGEHLEQFPVDVFQTGSGTSSNMNMNEVIASLAGSKVHPNDHVNRGQSSNDVIPTAVQISTAATIRDDLIPSLTHLKKTLEKKGKEFHSVLKSSRTHLMDAVPMRLGDEFRAFATLVDTSMNRLKEVQKLLCVVPLGGTAAGTGLNAHPAFAAAVIERIADETGLPLSEATDHVAAQSCPIALQAASSALKEVAVAYTKIANDIRWMGSGPQAGLAELQLPELQPGSSIMPGKVNPVSAESMLQVAAWVIGADTTVSVCVAHGSVFELNMCYPLLGCKLITSAILLSNSGRTFADNCVKDIKADDSVMRHRMERNAMLATALAPEIGYDESALIAREAVLGGETILEVAKRKTKISEKKLEKLLNPEGMV